MSKYTIWHGCYDGSLKDLIVPDAFAHPAKMSRILCERIFDHGHDKGYWQPEDVIIDPFGGIGTTAIIGAYRGYQMISVELEGKFHNLAIQNIELNQRNLEMLNNPLPILIQGDSRKLIELSERGRGAITSPPFLASQGGGGGINIHGYGENGEDKVGERTYQGNRGNRSNGNIEILPEGNHAVVTGALTSPPYSEARIGTSSGAAQVGHNENYGPAEGQLGSMPEGSLKGAITSPPWENILSADRVNPDQRRELARQMCENNAEHISPIDMETIAGREQKYAKYGNSEYQLGALSGDTYWSAVAVIYQQVFQLLPAGGAFAVVVKDFVRDKKRVPLCDQTAELLQALGFTIPERIKAMLVKKIPQPINMFTNEAKPKIVERKSFFRRLAEKKGSPRIDWEEVIWAVKP